MFYSVDGFAILAFSSVPASMKTVSLHRELSIVTTPSCIDAEKRVISPPSSAMGANAAIDALGSSLMAPSTNVFTRCAIVAIDWQ